LKNGLELSKLKADCLFQLTEIYVDSKRSTGQSKMTPGKKAKRQHSAGVLTLVVPRGGQKRQERF